MRRSFYSWLNANWPGELDRNFDQELLGGLSDRASAGPEQTAMRRAETATLSDAIAALPGWDFARC